ncbi:hypothetical protein [Corynebacterium riegelii]|uniref:hypothetical protein n=1 Tax=Corynebacterium riegelii TaxID=156976 RepID=UPI00288BD1F0|nr:hypothetical protein [Corynebacterium riegelii]
MIDISFAVDASQAILAQADLFNTSPTAPDGFTGPMQRLVGMAKWIGFVLVGIGIITVAGSMAVSRREGTSDEATSNALRIGFAALLLGSVGSLLGLLMGN